jgi:hypothetical protein
LASDERKAIFASRLADLLGGYQVDLLAYAIMSNHVHLILRPRPDLVSGLGAGVVVRKMSAAMPWALPGLEAGCKPTPAQVQSLSSNQRAVKEYRATLCSLSCLMKSLKHGVAREANRQEGVTGHFWEGRFMTVPLLDEGAVWSCMAYVDANPYRAGAVSDPFDGPWTSIRARTANPASLHPAEMGLRGALTSLTDCSPLVDVPVSRKRDLRWYKRWLRLCIGETASGDMESLPDQWCLASDWQDRMADEGLFQSIAEGSRQSRERLATKTGKKWIADKGRLWM